MQQDIHSSNMEFILSWPITSKEEVEGEVGNVGDTLTIHFVCCNHFVAVSCTWLVKGLWHEPYLKKIIIIITMNEEVQFCGGCHQWSHPSCEREIENISHYHTSMPWSSLQWLSKVTTHMTILWLSTYWHLVKGHHFKSYGVFVFCFCF